MGRFHYLLGVLLLFITSSLWIALKLRADSPSLTLGYGACLCTDDAKVNNTSAETKTIFLPQPSATNSQVKGTPLPVKSSYLPITNPYRHHKLSTFPAKLWQKTGPMGISPEREVDVRSWLGKNPSLRHEILTDRSADQYVREQYADYPHILDLYLSLQVPILKADLLRQLILYADGGIWSDLDVTCHQPIDTWIPEEFNSKANVVVGLEFDGFQFSSWTVMSKPRTSHIVAVIKYVIKALEDSATQNNVTVANLSMEMISDVVDVTGPQAMTRALFQNLELEMGLPMGRNNITNITQPTLFQDVLVLPNAAFAARQGGWPKDRGPYLVEHHYAGSWKNKNGGEQADADKQE
jgi:mannosyltransferase OCH1-like enzyme